MRDIFGRLVRYGLVGIATNAAGYLLYLLLTWIGLGPKTTMTILYAVGATAGYYGNRRLAFEYHGRISSSAMRYGVAHLCGYGLNFAVLYVLHDVLRYPHQIVQAVAILLVAGFLFLSFNFFVFPRQEQSMLGGLLRRIE